LTKIRLIGIFDCSNHFDTDTLRATLFLFVPPIHPSALASLGTSDPPLEVTMIHAFALVRPYLRHRRCTVVIVGKLGRSLEWTAFQEKFPLGKEYNHGNSQLGSV
jgi:hypothetical protein